MKIITVIITGMLLIASVTFGETAITIYNEDLGVVRETRDFEFPRGVGEIRFVDVAARIIPTSVHFSSERADLLEQNYEYDLVDAPKLMSRYINRNVELTTEDGVFTGILLSALKGVVLREEDQTIRLISQDRIVNVHFPDLPEGLITRPTS